MQYVEMVFKVICDEVLLFQVMFGMGLGVEVSNLNCFWGGVYDDVVFVVNWCVNDEELVCMVVFLCFYCKEVMVVLIGNEVSVDWNDYMVFVERLIEFVKQLGWKVWYLVIFCENYVFWIDKLCFFVVYFDVFGVYIYLVWEYKGIEEVFVYIQENYYVVKGCYFDKLVVIIEVGWMMCFNGCGIDLGNVSEDLQCLYYEQLMSWIKVEGILIFVFEVFDEFWKGFLDLDELEKYWGLFRFDCCFKWVMVEWFGKCGQC